MEKHKEHQKHHEHHKHHPEHHKKSKTLGKSFYNKIYVLLGIALIIFALYNTYQLSSSNTLLDKTLAEAKEAARPAEIVLVSIRDSNCKDCYDLQSTIDAIKGANVDITKEENLYMDSEKAKRLIDKYDIKKIPTVLIFGEIEKVNIENMKENNDALVLAQLLPPYTYTSTGRIAGLVSAITVKDSSCDKCVDLNQVLIGLKQLGVKIVSEKFIERDTNKGKELIKKHSLETVPVLILSKDLGDYDLDITKRWDSIGSIKKDGSYVTGTIALPYINLTTNKIVGLVSVTYLEDSSCKDCYDAADFHKPVLTRMGVVLEKEKSVDISSSEGQSLIEKYGIKKVPAVILKGDVEKYAALVGAWKDVGTVESDGAYVFRKVEIAKQPYKDLVKGEVIEPSATN